MSLEFDKEKKKRDEFPLKPFQTAIEESIYFTPAVDNKGLFKASIIDKFLIDFYIPFLPLERIHVKQCIRAELEKYQFMEKKAYEKSNRERDIDKIADELVYDPPGYNKFSISGCKRIPNLVRNLIVRNNYQIKEDL